jgi:excisionase family DNA binding protein
MDGNSDKNGLGLTVREIATALSAEPWTTKFPPILTVEEAAELLRVPVGTIYDWSSRELLKNCCLKVGRHLRFWRDRLLIHIFNNGLKS